MSSDNMEKAPNRPSSSRYEFSPIAEDLRAAIASVLEAAHPGKNLSEMLVPFRTAHVERVADDNTGVDGTYLCQTMGTLFALDIRGGAYAGHTQVVADRVEGWGAPYVGWTENEEGLPRMGLNINRLRSLDAFCQKQYGAPLWSGTHFETDAAEDSWRKLVDSGEAVREADSHRYHFVKNSL